MFVPWYWQMCNIGVDLISFSIRGALYSLYDPSYNLGVIIAFFLGNFLNCLDQLKVELLVLVIFAIVLFLFPESPEYLLKNHQEKVTKMSGNFELFVRMVLISASAQITSILQRKYSDAGTYWVYSKNSSGKSWKWKIGRSRRWIGFQVDNSRFL